VQETGVSRNLLEAIALKILYLEGELSLADLAKRMQLAFSVINELFERLRKEQLCEVIGMTAHVSRIVATSRGKTQAIELLSLSHYAGPAPVSLTDYARRVRAQSVRDIEIHPPDVGRVFKDLVLNSETLSQLGTAIVSGRSIFLYGPTGCGKTAIAEALPSVYQDFVWLPHAVEVNGQVIVVYDPHLHVKADDFPEGDGRWVLCGRPRILTGGDLTVESLDLQFNPVSKFYASPLQMKANNGVLIIDDFGRQRVRPEELLNRWIVPLDRRLDFLTLAGGKQFEIPFDLFVVFSTNLDPSMLIDEAFLRRIPNKVEVGYVNQAQFHEIFRRICSNLGLTCEPAVIDHLIETLGELHQPLRPCYPRDFVEQICWRARYEGRQPKLDRETLAQVCRSCFLSTDLPVAQKPA